MPRIAPALALAPVLAALTPGAALAGDPTGTWRTRPNDQGNYLLVTIAPCAGDAAKLCGTVTGARNAAGEPIDSAHVGKLMIRGMAPDGTDFWSGGTIWAPDDNETYRSKMELSGATLTVKGCVAGGLICRGQDWTRAE